MKKFIFTFLFALTIIGFKEVKATDYTEALRNNSAGNYSNKYYYFSDTALNNTTSFTYNNYTYIKPVIIRTQDSNSNFWRYSFVCKPSTNCIKYSTGNNTVYYSNNILSDSIEKTANIIYFNVPVFTDFPNASLYSRGEAFDDSSLLGGYNPPYSFDSSVTYSNEIKYFDYSFAYSGASPINSFSLYFEWIETPLVPSDCNRIFSIDYTYLEKTKLEQLYYAYGQDGLSWDALYSVYKTIRDGGASGILQFPNNCLTSKITFGIDGILNNSDYATWYDYDELDNYKFSFEWKETFPNPVTPIFNPYGLLEILKNYYGDYKKAFFSLNYLTFNFIDTYVVKSDGYTKKVYDYYNTFYLDKRKSDGYVFERRSFNTKNNINNDNINQNEPDNPIGSQNTPDVDLTQEQRNNSYNSTIQDSYNNIVNNYYYNNQLTDNILDYYNQFTDGGSNEDIDSALGYVKSTLGSLTHIPLLLGYCFTGFLPPEVLNLFYALLIIFVVFLIVRIIKHLFTH